MVKTDKMYEWCSGICDYCNKYDNDLYYFKCNNCDYCNDCYLEN